MATPVNYSEPATQSSMAYDMGVNAPIIHQRVIARLTARLYPLYESGAIAYEPLPETMLGEYSSRCDGPSTPDLILYDNNADQTPVIIEVCQTRGVRDDLQRVIQLIDGALYGISEAFVFNYKTQQWLRYQLGDGGITISSSYSNLLGLDLSQFV